MPNDWYLSNKTHSSSFVLSTWNIKIIIERNYSLQNKCIWHDKYITPFCIWPLHEIAEEEYKRKMNPYNWNNGKIASYKSYKKSLDVYYIS